MRAEQLVVIALTTTSCDATPPTETQASQTEPARSATAPPPAASTAPRASAKPPAKFPPWRFDGLPAASARPAHSRCPEGTRRELVVFREGRIVSRTSAALATKRGDAGGRATVDVAHALAAVKGWRSAQIWPCQGSPVSITAADAKAQRDGAALLTLQLTGRGSLKLVDRRGSKPKKLKNVAAITVGRPPTSFELPVELR